MQGNNPSWSGTMRNIRRVLSRVILRFFVAAETIISERWEDGNDFATVIATVKPSHKINNFPFRHIQDCSIYLDVTVIEYLAIEH